ncbi:uncharacterized protein PGRI_020420 [Penicillium griseofulvum]|uniref:Uncharacterized protein n=1 Tax=Penicillium patulum TaxID=5078 RepID=A0A135LGR1_PENPA|nr:uncharacterized protein PGRI_020420 [Penicillium griseofulvum]KXG48172.1 hypothetical protein PGRI_020420 [Penicillium griseofulvum]
MNTPQNRGPQGPPGPAGPSGGLATPHTEDIRDRILRPGQQRFGFLVFVVWRSVDGKLKERVVVDLRGLNKDVIKDTYPLPRPDNILRFVGGADNNQVR